MDPGHHRPGPLPPPAEGAARAQEQGPQQEARPPCSKPEVQAAEPPPAALAPLGCPSRDFSSFSHTDSPSVSSYPANDPSPLHLWESHLGVEVLTKFRS